MSVKENILISIYRKIIFLVVFSLLLLLPSSVKGEDTELEPLETAPQISLKAGRSFILEVPADIKRVSLADPGIADAMVLTPRQIYLTGKSAGVTSLTLWVDSRIYRMFDVIVGPDTSRLKEKIYEMMPDEKNINVNAAHNSITLSGTVSSSANLSRTLALAESYAPGRVNNFLKVGGVHQVMLEVKVAEVARSIVKRMGFNFNYIKGDTRLGLSMLNNLTSLPDDLLPNSGFDGINVTNPVNAIFRFPDGDTSWTIFFDALKEEGLLKILAEPTLITLSGQEADFLAGGEFPVPVPQELGRTTIEYKEFGVGLKFTPTVLSEDRINMQVAPEVSELDFTNAVAFGGFVIPGITTRRVSTMIELDDGQSFAIAGLLKDDVRHIVSKFPLLGDIPVLGALFRSSSFRKNETELVIIVTPHLVKPLDMAKQTMPTDQYIEPGDLEFYLLGNLEGIEHVKTSGFSASTGIERAGGLEGEFGHITPE